MGKKSRSRSGSGTSRIIFRELRTNFGFKKILKFFDADPDLGSVFWNLFDPGSEMKKFGSEIRDKRLRCATLVKTSLVTVR
jgi:hypothetical protein